ncbi:MAG: GNAT family N-acetyltransferase [Chloroflexi bacterium]|nr:GNAT family N-acetyltransferase [Chloroflexota bacterium]
MKSDIVLRNVSEADLPVFYEQQLDPAATQMAAFPSRDRDSFMAHWKNKVMNNDTNIVSTILFENQVAGNIVSWEQDGEREVGYWLGREYWGKGIASQALTEFLGIVKTRPLVAHVAKHNIASQRVLQKCGFTISGTARYLDLEGGDVEEIVLTLRE